MCIKKIFFISILILTFSCIKAQNHNLANPTIKSYLPIEYGASSQNWSIVQDSRGVMYVGNTQTVLEHNGTDWKSINLPNLTPARGLDINPKGELFVGTYDNFGLLAINTDGSRKFVSLSKNITDEKHKKFGDIWRVVAVSSGTYFFSPNKIFCWQNGKVTVIEVAMEAMFGFKAYDNVFVMIKDKGLAVLVNNELVLLPHTSFLNSTHRKYNIIEYNNEKILIASRNAGFYTYDLKMFAQNGKYNFKKQVSENVISQLNSDAVDYIAKNDLYSAAKINDNLFAFGTTVGGVVLLDHTGKLIRIINSNKGLNNNCIYALSTDKFGDLWAATQMGLCRIDISYPLSFFNYKINGIEGYTICSEQYKGHTFVGTMVGVFKLNSAQNNISGDELKFEKLNNEIFEVWDFEIINDILFVATSKGIYTSKGSDFVKISDFNATLISKSDFNDNIIFVSNDNGFFIFDINFDNSKVNTQKKFAFQGIKSVATGLKEVDNSELWISTKFHGMYNVHYNADDSLSIKLRNITQIHGLASNAYNNVYKIDDEIIISGDHGLFVPQKSGDSILMVKNLSLGKALENDTSNIAQIIKFKNKYIINSERERVGFLYKNNEEKYVFDNYFSKRFPSVYRVFPFENILHIYTSSGLYLFDLNYSGKFYKNFNTIITKIYLKNDSVLFFGTNYKTNPNDSIFTVVDSVQNLENELILEYKNNSLSFEFASVFFEDAQRTRYSYLLEGFDNDWTKPGNESKAVYTNLPEGDYIFKVKSINVFGAESSTAEYHFTVTAPWYRTYWAFAAYIILFFVFFYAALKLYSRRLHQKNKELEQIVIARTAEITQQKEELATINEDLEKLSIVASETDNAVLIMDENGEIEWINEGFMRLYGYTLDEFKKFGNIYQISSDPLLKEKIEAAVHNSKSIIYQSITERKNGEKIHAQTTVTPIKDESGKLKKIIAIDSDITKLKEAEEQIIQKSDEINAQKNELELKNHQIGDSIEYAKTIQNAMLPSKEIINSFFDSFIIYKPKDVVSGDFYWALPIADENAMIIAAVDCTGHGVPGAFMSMIGMSILNNIVNVNKIYQPSQIIEKLDIEIRRALRQSETDNKDGMDLGIIYLQKSDKNAILKFAGAKSPLIIYRNNDKSIEKIKGTRRSIGGIITNRNKQEFINHIFEIEKNDRLYLFSDGIADQNNFERVRLGTERLINAIQESTEMEMTIQSKYLSDMLAEWQKNEIQRDDMMLLGLKY